MKFSQLLSLIPPHAANEYTVNSEGDTVQVEEKGGQFMGATIVSSGEHVVVGLYQLLLLFLSLRVYGCSSVHKAEREGGRGKEGGKEGV